MFKTMFRIFIYIKVYNIAIIIILYLFSVLLLMMSINMINLADTFPKIFYEKGGSVGNIILLDILSCTLIAVIYFYKIRIERIATRKYQANTQNESYIKWNKWYEK